MSELQLLLIAWYRRRVIDRSSFVLLWGKEQGRLRARSFFTSQHTGLYDTAGYHGQTGNSVQEEK